MVSAFDPAEAPWRSLGDLVAAQAAKTPYGIALVAEDGVVTYAALAARTNRLARRLLKRGVGRDCIVPIFLDRSVEMIVATLAVLAAGGCYMPIDPEAPPARLALFLKDSGAEFMLGSGALVDRAALPADLEVLCLDDGSLAAECSLLSPNAISDAERSAPIQPQDLAFIVYTSGSTGAPKGSGNTQAGIVNCLTWLTAELGLGPDVRALQQTTYAFDMSLLEIFLPLINGGALVLIRPGGHRDLAYIAERIQAEAVTLLFFVPNMLMEFLRQDQARACTSLRDLVAAGERLSAYVMSSCHDILPGATLWNAYGPSETAVLTNLWRCRPNEGERAPPIGFPAWNTDLYILDPQGRPVADGAPGELYIAGAHVSRGYIRRPELTAERFVDCPFGPPGRKMYRSGDLVERRPDGALLFHGRGDSQIKLNGIRIELAEIEAALAGFPEIARAAVIARELCGEVRLIAYLVAAPGCADITARELRRALARTLPHALIPNHFIYVDQFPQTTSGKLLTRALPEPTPEASESAAPTVAEPPPHDRLASLLAELFAEVTGGPRVGVHQDFFDLGGTSLAAMRLAARLKRATGHTLPLRLLIEHPTPMRLAEALRQDATDWAPGAGSAAGDLPRIFVFAGAGGHGLGLGSLYRACAGLLDLRPVDYPDWRLFGGTDGVDRMIGRLAQQVAALDPTGPLRLAGYSLGGAIAYGVALELLRQGRTVAFVGLLDTEAMVSPYPPAREAARRRDDAKPPVARPGPEMTVWRIAWTQILRRTPIALLRVASATAQLAPMAVREDFERDLDNYVMVGLVQRWQHDRRRLSERLAAPLVLFRVREVRDAARLYGGWSYRGDRFDSVMVDGDHFTMLGPEHVNSLVAKLERAVREAEA